MRQPRSVKTNNDGRSFLCGMGPENRLDEDRRVVKNAISANSRQQFSATPVLAPTAFYQMLEARNPRQKSQYNSTDHVGGIGVERGAH